VIPHAASVFSAFGIALSDVKRVGMVSSPQSAPFDLDGWRTSFESLEASLREDLEREDLPTSELVFRRFVDLQFKRQVHTFRVPVQDEDLAAGDGGERVIERFTAMYEARNGPGTAYRRAGVEAMTLVVECVAPLSVPDAVPMTLVDGDAPPTPKEVRPVYFRGPDEFEDVAVYDAEALRPGERLVGPAVIEARDTTVLVHHGQPLWVDGFHNLRIDLNERTGTPQRRTASGGRRSSSWRTASCTCRAERWCRAGSRWSTASSTRWGTAPRRPPRRSSTARASGSCPESSTSTCTSATPGSLTRRTSSAGRPPRRPGG
jgi:N-methylhydantoinase A